MFELSIVFLSSNQGFCKETIFTSTYQGSTVYKYEKLKRVS